MTSFQQLLMMIWYCNTNGYCTACVIARPNLVSWLEWFFFLTDVVYLITCLNSFTGILESLDKFRLILLICPWMIKVLSILVEISFFQFFSWIHEAYDSFLQKYPISLQRVQLWIRGPCPENIGILLDTQWLRPLMPMAALISEEPILTKHNTLGKDIW